MDALGEYFGDISKDRIDKSKVFRNYFKKNFSSLLSEKVVKDDSSEKIQKKRYGDVKVGDVDYNYGKVVSIRRVKKPNYKHEMVDWIEVEFENGVRDLRLPDDDSFEEVKKSQIKL
jgi:hypothetical protein